MKEYYTFKLNLSHRFLKKYTSEEDKATLFFRLIPQQLDSLLGEGKKKDDYRYYSVSHQTVNLFPTKKYYERYEDLKSSTQVMYKKYGELLAEFEKTGNVMYPSEYIKLNEKCKEERYNLEKELPDLYKVYDDIRDLEVSKTLNIHSTLGIGTSHFFKMEKINRYLEKININFECIYGLKEECFYFAKTNFSDNKDFKDIKMYSKILTDLINNDNDFRKLLGKVTIIEQYEEIQLSETTRKVSIDLVYPNASIENEITTELSNLSKQARAENIKVEFEGNNLEVSNIAGLLTREGLAGYVKNVSSKGKKLILKITSFQ
ncbi:hypothetical protein [Lactococcus lactis]|uniref:hypothetical protein n=1 Tax=Lactococcus lactis TaxID=1358 RepID=UPI0021A864F8|nr:hypothetical protein [Lactococcus lactis]MCT0051888.1 hypothetical protein [Lactococcus lactis subsp. lactis]